MGEIETTRDLLRRLEIAQRVARWAGHQWGHTDLSALAEIPYLPYDRVETAVQVLTHATTVPGPAGWGITYPTVFRNGVIVVGIGRHKQLALVLGSQGGGLLCGVEAQYYNPHRVNCLMRAGHAFNVVAGQAEPRDYVRVLAALTVAMGATIDDGRDSWLARQEDRHYLETAEGQEYLLRARDVGRLLAGPESPEEE